MLVALAACPARAAAADAATPDWMVSLNGGLIDRDDDRARGYGAISLSHRIGQSYLRASVTRFGSAFRQDGAETPSTYTIGFLSAGTTRGHWFTDGYLAFGHQHYRAIRTPFGTFRPDGSSGSAIFGAGVDTGYVVWIDRRWSLTPSAAVQVVRSRALRLQSGPDGLSTYETRETGTTFGGTLRLDRLIGGDRQHDIGIRLTHDIITNASAALISGDRGAPVSSNGSVHQADGWTEIGGDGAFRLTRRLYLDVAVSRSIGLSSGDVTIATTGGRFLF